MNDDNFASELLQEVKNSSYRWFIAFVVMVILEFSTIIGFMWYISLPIDENIVTQTVDDIDGGEINQIGGTSYGSGDANSN